ncbi:MAG TPA: DUF167 domain-containing protein [Patescibacteria group bacterium]|nr:DUF167 domain-containing protein [Patescibacteria group bacterium]
MKLSIRITPNAKKTEIVGTDQTLFGDEVMKLKVAAPPVEGKANREVIEFFAKHYNVSKSKVRIVTGEKSRNKIIEVDK